MFDWIAKKLFGPFLHGLLEWSPWIWLAVCAVAAVWMLLAFPLLFKRWWQALAAVAVAGFIGLWVWQHFDGIKELENKNADLTEQLGTANQSIENLNSSIQTQADGMADLERRQKRINKELAAARVGLDSGTIMKEATNDPVKAATDMSDRWNALERMSDDETGSFGRSKAAATGPDADAGAAGPVGNP